MEHTCCFFGHSECYGLDENCLMCAIDDLIQSGVDTFYVGHQGHFDGIVLSCLEKLSKTYPEISISVVLAYLPTQKSEYDLYRGYSMFPEGLEEVHPKFAIEKRNKWMIEHADYCVCYITHTWGGAFKFAKQAKRKGLHVINLGSITIEGSIRRGKKA